jgi:hypothetical protein
LTLRAGYGDFDRKKISFFADPESGGTYCKNCWQEYEPEKSQDPQFFNSLTRLSHPDDRMGSGTNRHRKKVSSQHALEFANFRSALKTAKKNAKIGSLNDLISRSKHAAIINDPDNPSNSKTKKRVEKVMKQSRTTSSRKKKHSQKKKSSCSAEVVDGLTMKDRHGLIRERPVRTTWRTREAWDETAKNALSRTKSSSTPQKLKSCAKRPHLCVTCSKPFDVQMGKQFKLEPRTKCSACLSAQVTQSADRCKLMKEQHLLEQQQQKLVYVGRVRHWDCPFCKKLTDGFETHCIGCSRPNQDQRNRLQWKETHFMKTNWLASSPYTKYEL